MAFFRAFNCRILYSLYLPTVILTVIWYSITHSLFLSRLKTLFLYKSFPLQPFLSSYLNIYYMDSPDCLLLFLGISVFYFQFFLFLHFLVVGSLRQIKLTHVGFRAHVKIASRSRIVSFSPNPFHCSLFSFSFFRTDYMIPQTFTVASNISAFTFQFFCFTVFSCRLRAVD